MKLLTKTAVHDAAESLMGINEETTVPEVTDLLHKQGYQAVEETISVMMTQLCHEMDWEVHLDGEHPIYRKRPNFDQARMQLMFSAN
jgi:predicted transcriptional regulator